jgi:hypothetical protein
MCPPVSAFLPDEEEQQTEHFRRISPADKFREIARLNDLQAERQRAEIRVRHGDIPEEEMRVRLAVLRLGSETVAKVLGIDRRSLEEQLFSEAT